MNKKHPMIKIINKVYEELRKHIIFLFISTSVFSIGKNDVQFEKAEQIVSNTGSTQLRNYNWVWLCEKSVNVKYGLFSKISFRV